MKWNYKKFIKNILFVTLVIYFIYIIISMFSSVFNVMTLQEFLNI